MEDKKRPDPVGKREPGKKQMRQKYFRHPHLNKFKQNIPPRYDKKFDREILQNFARQFKGSLIGKIADERLREISDQPGGIK